MLTMKMTNPSFYLTLISLTLISLYSTANTLLDELKG